MVFLYSLGRNFTNRKYEGGLYLSNISKFCLWRVFTIVSYRQGQQDINIIGKQKTGLLRDKLLTTDD